MPSCARRDTRLAVLSGEGGAPARSYANDAPGYHFSRHTTRMPVVSAESLDAVSL